MAVPCLVLLACGATSTPVKGPDGRPGWYSIECRHDELRCEDEAGDVCPQGYVTANRSGYEGLVSSASYLTGYTVPTFHGHMLIKCDEKHRSANDE
jgi:hypothetical protein